MNIETMTLNEIRIEGLKALEQHLGPEGMIRFLQQFEKGRGDYTQERRKWLKERSVERLAEEIVSTRKMR